MQAKPAKRNRANDHGGALPEAHTQKGDEVSSRFAERSFTTTLLHERMDARIRKRPRGEMGVVAKVPDQQQASETGNLHDRDFYTWAVQQAAALRRRDFSAVDWENVTEEIETLGRTEERSLKSQYARAMEHLLKLQYRGDEETEPVAGWRKSVDQARIEIKRVLQDNPGLKGKRDEVFARAWLDAREDAVAAFVQHSTEGIKDDTMHLRERKRLTREWSNILPREIPYTREQVEDSFWMPEQIRLAQRPQSPRQPVRKPDGSR